jgi:hypothetical protein
VNQRAVMIVGLIVAIALAVTLLALTATTKARSASPRLVPLTPAALAYQAQDGHRYSSGPVVSVPAVPSSGIGHR